MAEIVVYRVSQTRMGPDVVEILLNGDVGAMTARGLCEIEEEAAMVQEVDLRITYRDGLRLGQIAEVEDTYLGVSWRGKVIGVRHEFSGADTTTVVRLRRPEAYYV